MDGTTEVTQAECESASKYVHEESSQPLRLLAQASDTLNHLYVSLMFGAAAHLVWQIARVKAESVESCAKMFRANASFGAIIFMAIVLGKNAPLLLRSNEAKE
jgi:hypothetical protein